jgi:hypothetical protein
MSYASVQSFLKHIVHDKRLYMIRYCAVILKTRDNVVTMGCKSDFVLHDGV